MRYLGIDFGLKRIGLATSNGILAAPFKIIEVKGFKDGLEKIIQIVETENIDKLIIGLSEGKMGETITGFVNLLRKRGLDVQTSDETLSTYQAKLQMIEANMPKNKRRKNDDKAAAIILQNYLNNI